MLALIREHLPHVLRAVGPLVTAVSLLQIVAVDAPGPLFLQFLVGSMLATAGMVLLFAGIDVGILPMGRFIGAELPRRGSLSLILGVAFAVGFATTAAEPDVIVLATQVAAASEGTVPAPFLVTTVSTGVGVFAALALLRIMHGFSMTRLLTILYLSAIGLSVAAPERFVPLAFDTGSVTTGLLTTPVVLALALGFNAVLARRSNVADGFGLLGLASTGPVLVVLLLSLLLGG